MHAGIAPILPSSMCAITADLGGSAVCDVRLPTRRDGSLWCIGGIVNAGWQTEQGRAYVRRGLPQMGVIYLSARD
jgi:hypothetical protein